ncbi:uncharacterized protein LOC133527685 [Cydia pomonella]|uniref:uncharacterized protein LOC133527685 n=1 Tax=Cydia pomonella TaxID=82600 RepID=UPI002ADE6A5B|nr:uncharacterized protein LOC133527685 [Cydia pomonella]
MFFAGDTFTLVLALGALVGAARADCDACVAGLCHSRRPILTGFPVTDQLAIDRANNVLYLQLNSNQNTAIFLDDLQHRLVNMMRTSGMAVDQKTSVLYLGTKEVKDTYYEYDLVSNTTKAINTSDDNRKSDIMCYADDTLYFIHKNHNGVNLYNTTANGVWHKTNLEDYSINDFVVIDNYHLLFVSNNTVYKYVWNDVHPYFHITLIARKNYVLSVDKNNDVFLADSTEKVIYKVNKTTDKLETYARYKSGLIADFVFDGRDRVVLRDARDVAQWLPAPAHRRCAFDHQGGFLVKEL